MNYAVDKLGDPPNTFVYLDATHNAWLNVGDITDRLLRAGLRDADGFFLNASNYRCPENLVQYGTIAAAPDSRWRPPSTFSRITIRFQAAPYP